MLVESEIVVVGAGPAGLQAAIYCASEGFQTVIVERDKVGGRILQTPKLENFIGQSPKGVSGPTFVRKARQQAENLGAMFVTGNVDRLEQYDGGCRLYMRSAGSATVEVRATRAIIIATGMQWDTLNIPGATKHLNRSWFYGPFMTMKCDKGERYAVVGGGNSSGQAVITLAEHAQKVSVIARSGLSTMSKYLVDRIAALENVEIIVGSTVAKVGAKGVTLTNGNKVEADKTFFNAAAKPNTEWLPSTLLDKRGFIMTGGDGRQSLQTVIPNLFAIGDVRADVWRRNVGNAVSDANRVVSEVFNFVSASHKGLGNSIHA
jgi:thioredoxin reductase (NADPH)